MLVKHLEVRRYYTKGFKDSNSPVNVEIFDKDRGVVILSGNEATEKIMTKLEGIKLGMGVTGYNAVIDGVIEFDMVTNKTRTLFTGV